MKEKTNHVKILLVAVQVLVIVLTVQNVKATESIKAYLHLERADCVIITYWSNGDLRHNSSNKKNCDKLSLQRLLNELDKVPAQGPGRRAKLNSDSPEYKVDFLKNKTKIASLRIKSGMLDSPYLEGWDFYPPGVDSKVVKTIEEMFKSK